MGGGPPQPAQRVLLANAHLARVYVPLSTLREEPFGRRIFNMQTNVGIVTISDRASKGLYDDLGGPALKKAAPAAP